MHQMMRRIWCKLCSGMAATRSFSSLLFTNILVLIGCFVLYDFDRYFPNSGLNRLAFFSSYQEFFETAITLKIFLTTTTMAGSF